MLQTEDGYCLLGYTIEGFDYILGLDALHLWFCGSANLLLLCKAAGTAQAACAGFVPCNRNFWAARFYLIPVK